MYEGEFKRQSEWRSIFKRPPSTLERRCNGLIRGKEAARPNGEKGTPHRPEGRKKSPKNDSAGREGREREARKRQSKYIRGPRDPVREKHLRKDVLARCERKEKNREVLKLRKKKEGRE